MGQKACHQVKSRRGSWRSTFYTFHFSFLTRAWLSAALVTFSVWPSNNTFESLFVKNPKHLRKISLLPHAYPAICRNLSRRQESLLYAALSWPRQHSQPHSNADMWSLGQCKTYNVVWGLTIGCNLVDIFSPQSTSLFYFFLKVVIVWDFWGVTCNCRLIIHCTVAVLYLLYDSL